MAFDASGNWIPDSGAADQWTPFATTNFAGQWQAPILSDIEKNAFWAAPDKSYYVWNQPMLDPENSFGTIAKQVRMTPEEYQAEIERQQAADTGPMESILSIASILAPAVLGSFGGLDGLFGGASDGLNAINSFDSGAMNTALNSGTAATAGAGGGGMSWLDTLFNSGGDSSLLSNFGQDGAMGGLTGDYVQPSAWDFGPGNILDSIGGDANAWAFGPGNMADFGGTIPTSGISSFLQSIGVDPTSTAAKTILGSLAGGSGGGLLGTGLSGLGAYLQGKSATDAAQTAANTQLEAARLAADAAKFRPVGVTTRFGGSNFQKDAQGNITGAGYTLTPDVKALQDQLMGATGGMLGQFTGSQAATAPMGQAAQSLFGLGQGYLGTTPQAQAQKYMQEQQALLAAGRERDLANLQTRLAAQGRLGLATGGTSTGMMAANPELEALFNAQRQQDLELAAKATQGGMDYTKFGAGLAGLGGDLLKGMYGTQTASYQPFQTALGGASMIEGLGQQALDTGVNLGRQTSNAGAGQLLAQGMNNAAQTMQPANAYSPWGSLLSGLGNTLGTYGQPQQQYRFDPFTGSPL